MEFFGRKVFSVGLVIAIALAVFLLVEGPAYAQVTIPHFFSPGTTISSSQVNSNFSTLSNAMPAVKQRKGQIWLEVPTNNSVIQSITVTPPAAGFVIVMAVGGIEVKSSSSTGFVCLDLSNAAKDVDGCIPMAGSVTGWRSYLPANFGDGINMSYSIVETFPVSPGIEHTYYLNGYATGLSLSSLLHPTLTVIFVPNALP